MNPESFMERTNETTRDQFVHGVLRDTGLVRSRLFFSLFNLLRCAPLCLWILPAALPAQSPPAQDPLMSLMLSAPQLDTAAPVIASAGFDPAQIQPGESAVYRVTLNALLTSVTGLPTNLVSLSGIKLKRGASGEVMRMAGNRMQPVTVFNYHVSPSAAGVVVVPEFELEIYGRPVKVPAASLEVLSRGQAPAPQRRLWFELSATNAYVGQSLRARVILPGNAGGVQGVAQVELKGEGFLLDRSDVRQTIAPTLLPDGRQVPAFVYDAAITPFVRGATTLFAQGFTVGMRFGAQITLQGGLQPGGVQEYLLLESDPVTIQVRPLPPEGRLPGFSGAIGRFTRDEPKLSTNSVRVGDPLKLTLVFHGEAGVSRLVPPAPPRVRGWQCFADPPGPTGGNIAVFSYTLIAQDQELSATPEIPFSSFDPVGGVFVDLSVPSLAVKVLPGPVSSGAQAWQADSGVGKRSELSVLAKESGPGRKTLRPLRWQPGFIGAEAGVLAAILGLWLWDRRRRHLLAHPEILMRRRAIRALGRARRALRRAVEAGDTAFFVESGVAAMRVISAPHYPAEPQALVCSDVLRLLGQDEAGGESAGVARRIFAAADAARFDTRTPALEGLMDLAPGLDRLLEQLEARL